MADVVPALCTFARAAELLETTVPHIKTLVRAGRLRTAGRGRGEAVIKKSLEEYRAKGYATAAPTGYVYLIYWHGYYKIGMAQDVNRRADDIGCSHPVRPVVEHIIATNNMARLEARLHERYASRRVSGEWFDLSADDVRHIKAIGASLMD